MATLLGALALAYCLLGGATAAFVLSGLAARFDPAARGASLAFRLAIAPGTVLLWPVVLLAAVRGDGPPDRTAHDEAARTEPHA